MTLDSLTHARRPADDLYALPDGDLTPQHVAQALVFICQARTNHPTALRFHSLHTPPDTIAHCPQLGIAFAELPMCL